MRLLITRPAGDAQAAAGALQARGHAVLACPLIEVQKTGDAKPNLSAIQAFLVTDADGARALADAVGVRTFPVFCESAGTATELNRLGFKDARSADGDATTLARLIERSLTPKWGGLVYVCSTSAPVNLQAILGNMGFAVRMTALYDVKRADALPTQIADALKNDALDAVVFFSADEARAFVQLVQRAELEATTERLIAIVAAPVVAAPITVLKFAKVVSAAKSDALSVIDVVSNALLPQPEPEIVPEPAAEPITEPEVINAPVQEPEPIAVVIESEAIEPAPSVPAEPEPEVVVATLEPEAVAEAAESHTTEILPIEAPQPEAIAPEPTPEPEPIIRSEPSVASRLDSEPTVIEPALTTQIIADVADSNAVPDVTAPHPTPKPRVFAALSGLMSRWKTGKADNQSTAEIATDLAPTPGPTPTPDDEHVLIPEPIVVTGLEAVPTPIEPELPPVEPEIIEASAPEPVAAPEPPVIPEPIVVSGLEAVPVVMEIEEPPPQETLTEVVSAGVEDPSIPRETIFKKFSTFMSRYRGKDEPIETAAAESAPETMAQETPKTEETAAIELEPAPQEPVLDIVEEAVVEPPSAEPVPIVVPEFVAASVPEPENEIQVAVVDAAPVAALEVETIEVETIEIADAPVAELQATPPAEAKPSLWAKARGVMSHLRAKKPPVTAPSADAEASDTNAPLGEPHIPEELAPPIPDILAAHDEEPAATVAIELPAPEPAEIPEPVVEPEPIAEPDSSAEPEPPAVVPPPEPVVEPEPPPPDPVVAPVQETPPQPTPEPISESPVFVTEKSPTEELPLGTMPPPPGPAQPDDTSVRGPDMKDSLVIPAAAILDQMDTSSDDTKSSGESMRSRTGGRSARLLAEDAADARALNQRFKFGGTDNTESEPAAADSTSASPQRQTRQRPRSNAVPLVVGLFVLAGVGYYTSSWWLPQLRSTPAATAPTETALVTTNTPATNQLGDLQARADALAADIVALNQRMGAVEQRPVAAGDPAALAELTKRIAVLESAPSVDGTAPEGLSTSVTNQARQLASVTARVATLEAAIGNVAKLEDLASRLASLEGKSAEANSVLALGERLASLEKRDAVAATALVLATAQLREATQSGRSYAVELETVAQLAARADVPFDATVLKASAPKGLTQLAALKTTFPDAATKIVRAGALPDNTTGWVRRVLDRIYAIISVRPFGTLEGESTGAIVARAEQALRSDNLAQTVAELDTLKGPALDAAQVWLTQARATLTAQNTIDDLSARSVGAMSAISRIAPAAEPKAP